MFISNPPTGRTTEIITGINALFICVYFFLFGFTGEKKLKSMIKSLKENLFKY